MDFGSNNLISKPSKVNYSDNTSDIALLMKQYNIEEGNSLEIANIVTIMMGYINTIKSEINSIINITNISCIPLREIVNNYRTIRNNVSCIVMQLNKLDDVFMNTVDETTKKSKNNGVKLTAGGKKIYKKPNNTDRVECRHGVECYNKYCKFAHFR